MEALKLAMKRMKKGDQIIVRAMAFEQDGAEAPPCSCVLTGETALRAGLDDEVGCTGEIQIGHVGAHQNDVACSRAVASIGRGQINPYIAAFHR